MCVNAEVFLVCARRITFGERDKDYIGTAFRRNGRQRHGNGRRSQDDGKREAMSGAREKRRKK